MKILDRGAPLPHSETLMMPMLSNRLPLMIEPVVCGPDERGPADGGRGGAGTLIAPRTRTQSKRPSLYRVLLLNDDYTPMEFVIHVLQAFFNKSIEDATEIMLHVHHSGVGECGVYTYEIAETKVTLVMDFARQHNHPLQCVMEKK